MLLNRLLAIAWLAFAQVPLPPEGAPEDVEDQPETLVPDGILPLGEIARIELGPSDRTRLLLHERKLVLVTKNGSVEARDTASGAFSWKLGLPGEVFFPPVALRFEPFEILLSSPAGKLLVVEGETGNIRQEISLGFELAFAPHPAASLVYIGTPSGTVVAFDLASGGERFRVETAEKPLAFALGSGLLVVSGASRTLTALDAANGDPRWMFRARAGFAAAAVFGEKGDRLYIGDDAGEFYCLSSDEGDVRYRWSTGAAIRHSALVAGKRVYVTSFGNVLYAFDASGGAEQWRANLPGRPASGPLPVRNRLLVATLDGTLVEVNPERGQIAKSYTVPGELDSPPSFWVAAEPPPLPEEPIAAASVEGEPVWYERHRIALTLRSGQVLLLGHQASAPEPEPEPLIPSVVPRWDTLVLQRGWSRPRTPSLSWGFGAGTKRATSALTPPIDGG